MNANFGLILRKSMMELLLLPSEPIVRSWGNELVEPGQRKYTFPLLEKIEYELYPLTSFIKNHLPTMVAIEEFEYAWMSGKALDEYEEWLLNNDVTTQEKHPFETGLFELIRQAGEAAIMFAPEGERLGEFVNVDSLCAIDLLRSSVTNIAESNGFLAIIVS